jgi:hypothetical protein
MASYSNDVAALVPANWADAIQENLYKELVAMKVGDTRFESKLSSGTTVHFPMFGSLSTTAYVKGVDVTVQALDSTDEYLTIDQSWESSFYLDTVDQRQNLYSAMEAGIREATDAIKQKVETVFFAQVLNASDTLDAGDMSTGSAGDAVALTTTNVIEFFSKGRKKLGKALKGKEAVAVISYAVASVIEQKMASAGFNIQDSALKNGYAGDFMGWKIYVSENLDETSSRTHCYLGANKQISLAMQIAPTTAIDNDPLKFGKIVKLLEVFGVKTFTRASQRFLDAQVTVA